MAIFDPSKYEDEKPDSFTAPKGQYELYVTEQSIKISQKGVKYLAVKVTFDNGPRKGKYFFHNFFLWQDDPEKRKKALGWFATFCKAIGVGPFDPEVDGDLILNKPFIGDVDIEFSQEYGDKNVLKPWGFHKLGESATPT
jgi:hypothetical protein